MRNAKKNNKAGEENREQLYLSSGKVVCKDFSHEIIFE